MPKQEKLFTIFYYLGLLQLAVWFRRLFGPRLIILNYHRASGGDLRNHLLYLRRHYRILHLEEALKELYEVNKSAKQVRDRRTMLVLTFDDGHHDIYTHAFPLARELQVPITVFLIPGYIESPDCYWWLVGDCLVEQAQVDKASIEGCSYDLSRPEGRTALARAIYTRAREAQSVAEREAFLTMVRAALAVPALLLTEKEAVVNWEEIREMERSGWVSYGAHTMHHPVLAYLNDPAEIQYEVAECLTVLEQQLGHPVRTFAYPIGKAEHIGQRALQGVRGAGYAAALTTIYGVNTPESDPLQLHRIAVDVSWHWLLIAADAAGVRNLLKPGFSFWKGMLSAGRMLVNSLLTFQKSVMSFPVKLDDKSDEINTA